MQALSRFGGYHAVMHKTVWSNNWIASAICGQVDYLDTLYISMVSQIRVNATLHFFLCIEIYKVTAIVIEGH